MTCCPSSRSKITSPFLTSVSHFVSSRKETRMVIETGKNGGGKQGKRELVLCNNQGGTGDREA